MTPELPRGLGVRRRTRPNADRGSLSVPTWAIELRPIVGTNRQRLDDRRSVFDRRAGHGARFVLPEVGRLLLRRTLPTQLEVRDHVAAEFLQAESDFKRGPGQDQQTHPNQPNLPAKPGQERPPQDQPEAERRKG